jgi:hypothetical protein
MDGLAAGDLDDLAAADLHDVVPILEWSTESKAALLRTRV